MSSPSRGRVNYDVPIFMTSGAGGRITDADGNEYVDLMMAYGALLHGHAHPRLVAAGERAVRQGTLFATASEVEVDVAERISALVPGAERVRFANTGTEATMAAIRIARAVTGRPLVVKFEGHYHGWHDAFLVSSPPARPGHARRSRRPAARARLAGPHRRLGGRHGPLRRGTTPPSWPTASTATADGWRRSSPSRSWRTWA